jgi:hypothetical protein
MRYLALVLAIAVLLFPNNIFALTSNTHSTDIELSSSHYWSIADASQTGLDITGDMTISAWVNWETEPSVGQDRNTIVAKFDHSSGNTKAYQWAIQYTGGAAKHYLLIADASSEGSEVTETLDTQPSAGTWYNYVVTYTAASDDVQFYLNGTADGTAQNSGKTSMQNTGTAFTIATALNSGSLTRNMDGKIDDVRIWSRVLNSTEVGLLYTDPCNADNGASLQGWWVFDNSGLDETANNNDLTANNSVGFTTTHAYDCAAAAAAPVDDTIFDLL